MYCICPVTFLYIFLISSGSSIVGWVFPNERVGSGSTMRSEICAATKYEVGTCAVISSVLSLLSNYLRESTARYGTVLRPPFVDLSTGQFWASGARSRCRGRGPDFLTRPQPEPERSL